MTPPPNEEPPAPALSHSRHASAAALSAGSGVLSGAPVAAAPLAAASSHARSLSHHHHHSPQQHAFPPSTPGASPSAPVTARAAYQHPPAGPALPQTPLSAAARSAGLEHASIFDDGQYSGTFLTPTTPRTSSPAGSSAAYFDGEGRLSRRSSDLWAGVGRERMRTRSGGTVDSAHGALLASLSGSVASASPGVSLQDRRVPLAFDASMPHLPRRVGSLSPSDVSDDSMYDESASGLGISGQDVRDEEEAADRGRARLSAAIADLSLKSAGPRESSSERLGAGQTPLARHKPLPASTAQEAPVPQSSAAPARQGLSGAARVPSSSPHQSTDRFETALSQPPVPGRVSSFGSASVPPDSAQAMHRAEPVSRVLPLLSVDSRVAETGPPSHLSSESDYGGEGDWSEVELDSRPRSRLHASSSIASLPAESAPSVAPLAPARAARPPSPQKSSARPLSVSPTKATFGPSVDVAASPTRSTAPRASASPVKASFALARASAGDAPVGGDLTGDKTDDLTLESEPMSVSPSKEAALEAQLAAEAADADPNRPRTLKEARALAKERKMRRLASESQPSASPVSTSPEERKASAPAVRRSMDRPVRDPKRHGASASTSFPAAPDAEEPLLRPSSASDRSMSEYSVQSNAPDAAATSAAAETDGQATSPFEGPGDAGVYRRHSRQLAQTVRSPEGEPAAVGTQTTSSASYFPNAQTNARRFGQISPPIGSAETAAGASNGTAAPDGVLRSRTTMEDLQAAVGDALDDLSFGSTITDASTAMAPHGTSDGEALDVAPLPSADTGAAKATLPHPLDMTRVASAAPSFASAAASAKSFDSAVEFMTPSSAMSTSQAPLPALPRHPFDQVAPASPSADNAAPTKSPSASRPVAQATPRPTGATAPTRVSRLPVFGRTSAWPTTFDPTPIIEKRKLAPWERARAYAEFANDLAGISTGLEVWISIVQRPAQAQAARGTMGATRATANKLRGIPGLHARDTTDSSAYAASVRSDATFPMRGDGGRAKELTAVREAGIPESPPSMIPPNIPYPALLPGQLRGDEPSALGVSSQNDSSWTLMDRSRTQSSSDTATEESSAPGSSPTHGRMPGSGNGPSAVRSGAFFSALGRKGSRRTPGTGSLSVTSTTASSPTASTASGPRGMRASLGRTISRPMSPAQPVDITRSPSNAGLALSSSPTPGPAMSLADENAPPPPPPARTIFGRGPLGPRAPSSRSNSTDVLSQSSSRPSLASFGSGRSGLGAGEARGTYYGLSATGGIYAVPQGQRSSTTLATAAAGVSDYRDNQPRAPAANRSPSLASGLLASPALSSGSGGTPPQASPAGTGNGVARSSFSYGSVRERSPHLGAAGFSPTSMLAPPAAEGGDAGSRTLSPRKGSFATTSSTGSNRSDKEAQFEQTLEKLEDVLPDADRATLAVYLKKAGGNDLAAIGDYLQDQARGKLRRA